MNGDRNLEVEDGGFQRSAKVRELVPIWMEVILFKGSY
jgi:hypothetical protein